ncbi:MAG: hypothetical protein OEM22_07310 [Acidimicrobiia bacterium]|nr:hypothetical protein [Acidimicrobiia bacterium]
MTQHRVEWSPSFAKWAIVAAVAAILSALVPLTFDEAIWVWAGREIFAGGIPYREVVDHKTIIVFALEGLLDLAPGPFELARAVAVGITIAVIGAMARGVFRGMGGDDRVALRIGLVTAAVAFIQTRLVSTVELWATAAMLGALLAVTNKRYRLAAVVTCLGALIDIRALLLTPVVVIFAAEQGGRSALRKFVMVLAPLLLVAITAVLAFPDIRFGVVELAMESRSTQFYPFDQAMVGLRALILPAVLIPIIVGVNRNALGSAFRRSGALFLIAAIAIAVVSRLPIVRYWLYVVPAIPLIAHQLQKPDTATSEEDRLPRVVIVALAALALLPGIFRIVDETMVITREPLERFDNVVLQLESGLAPGQSFIHYPDKPYLPAYLPERFTAPSVVMHYYVRDTRRRELALTQLQTSIDAASVVVEEGQLELEPEAISPAERKVVEIFRAKLSDFPCTQVIGPITLHWRSNACPTDRIP